MIRRMLRLTDRFPDSQLESDFLLKLGMERIFVARFVYLALLAGYLTLVLGIVFPSRSNTPWRVDQALTIVSLLAAISLLTFTKYGAQWYAHTVGVAAVVLTVVTEVHLGETPDGTIYITCIFVLIILCVFTLFRLTSRPATLIGLAVLIIASYRIVRANNQSSQDVTLQLTVVIVACICGFLACVTHEYLSRKTFLLSIDLHSTNKDLDEANGLKSQLMEISALHLGNPLEKVIRYAEELIDEHADDPDLRKDLNGIRHGAERMERLIKQLLTLSEIETGHLPMTIEPIDLSGLIHQLGRDVEQMARQKAIQLEVICDPNIQVHGDREKIISIWENLVSNALKYSPAGKTVRVEVHRTDNHIQLTVTDEGPGLNESDHKNLFQSWRRLSAQPTAGESSTGLGLSIVKSFVEMHHGSIRAQSDGPGRGTAFHVEIPIRPASSS